VVLRQLSRRVDACLTGAVPRYPRNDGVDEQETQQAERNCSAVGRPHLTCEGGHAETVSRPIDESGGRVEPRVQSQQLG
jgi:hypothetical protein